MENGQGRTSQLDYLDYGCQLISEMYGKPDIAEWTNSDYIKLSNILYKKTRVQISPNTLKRIFGKIKTDARYYPQKATRDALVNYIGYPNWESFTNSQVMVKQVNETPAYQHQVTAVIPVVVAPLNKWRPFSKKKALKLVPGLIALVLLTAIATYYLSFRTVTPVEVSMVCRNPIGGNPHSAIFALKGIDQGSSSNPFYIDFGDSRKMILTTTDSLVSHYYEEPGRYYAVLKQNRQVMDSSTVFLRSTGWTATAKMMYDTTRVYPIDIPDLFRGKKNSIGVGEVSRAGVDTNRTFFIDFTNTQVTEIDGDNFDLVAKVQTSADRAGVRCSQVRLTVFGEYSRHRIDVMKPGCLHWTNLQISEVLKDGHVEGLDFLGADLRQGGTLRLTVKNKRARLYINGRQVYETTYSKSLKRIYGLDIMFAGVGTIHSVTLKDLKTQKAFPGNF